MAPGAFANENSPLQPSSPYSASKAGSDLLVLSYVRTYGFPGLITRSSNNYGPYQFPEKFLPLLITNALDDKSLPIYGDGKQQRNWLHVEDNCRGVLAVLEGGRVGEVYNIGGLDIEENLTIARTLLRLIGKSETLLSFVKDRPGHDRRYALRCDKIEKELGWKPIIPLEQGLQQTIDWYKSNLKWLACVRDRAYLSYYEKYYENRDPSLHAHSSTGPKHPRSRRIAAIQPGSWQELARRTLQNGRVCRSPPNARTRFLFWADSHSAWWPCPIRFKFYISAAIPTIPPANAETFGMFPISPSPGEFQFFLSPRRRKSRQR
jgi:hypothetical protein